jgi:hypothetical protein
VHDFRNVPSALVGVLSVERGDLPLHSELERLRDTVARLHGQLDQARFPQNE